MTTPVVPWPTKLWGPDLRSLSGADKNAYHALTNLFEYYGLESLAPQILDYIQKGYDSNTISILLQQSYAYKERFKANEYRRKIGLPVLAPADYLAAERTYRQIYMAAGFPTNFWDRDTLSQLIEYDVSPTELQNRVELANRALSKSNPNLRAALEKIGLTQGVLASYFLDRDKSENYIRNWFAGMAIDPNLLERTVTAAEIGAEAFSQGLGFNSRRALQYADMGISAEEAREGFGAIAEFLPQAQKLSDIYGENDYTQATAEAEIFGQNAAARKQRKRLASQERAAFGGAVGGARAGLSSGPGGQV